ncbi:hypothetical protein ACEQ8H_006998 [Pleosporales sp. CAS-2024a]
MSHLGDKGICEEEEEYAIRNALDTLHTDWDMEKNMTYRVIPGPRIPEEQWRICAATFSRHYGIWGSLAHQALGSWAIQGSGKRIVMSPDRLRAQCMPPNANNVLIAVVTAAGKHVGQCFVSQWMYNGSSIWWITQLVVDSDHRNKKMATRMLQTLVQHYKIGRDPRRQDHIGVLSSHPYMISAVLRVFGRGIEALPMRRVEHLSTCDVHIPLPTDDCVGILFSSPVDYVRHARLLRDSLSAFTEFFVDHSVPDGPDQSLQKMCNTMSTRFQTPWNWYFGNLDEGCEYLCVLQYRHEPEYSSIRMLVVDMDQELEQRQGGIEREENWKREETERQELYFKNWSELRWRLLAGGAAARIRSKNDDHMLKKKTAMAIRHPHGHARGRANSAPEIYCNASWSIRTTRL